MGVRGRSSAGADVRSAVSELAANDPRITGEYIRWIRSDRQGDVYLVGVVHDHPASEHRVRSVVRTVDPEVLALELPPIALPRFEQHARDRARSGAGGEMGAAIAAADPDRVVGIDGPTIAFLRTLLATISGRDVAPATIGTVLRGLLAVTTDAMRCRVRAHIRARFARRRRLPQPRGSAQDRLERPEAQAADERAKVDRSASMKSIFGESGAVRLRDEARESYMRDRLAGCRKAGTVVAVVGVDHLDAVAQRLRNG